MDCLEKLAISCAMLFGIGASPVFAQNCKQVRLAANQIRVTQPRASLQDSLMVVSMNLNLDSLQLPSNMRLMYTPMVVSADTTLYFPQIIINGRRQQIMYERKRGNEKKSSAWVVRRENDKAQTVDYRAVMPVDGRCLTSYDLRLHEDLCGCGDLQDGSDVALLSGLHHVYAKQEKAKAKAWKIYQLDKKCYIDFPVDQTRLYVDYHRNAAQLDSIVNTINVLRRDSNLEVLSINIHGFASPESPYQHNAYLAEHRSKEIAAYVRRMVNLPDSIFSISYTAEDWEGLRSYIQNSNLEHRAEILAIAKDESLQPDEREGKIKKLYPAEYRFMLNAWYPYLRHTDYHIAYRVKRMEEIEEKDN